LDRENCVILPLRTDLMLPSYIQRPCFREVLKQMNVDSCEFRRNSSEQQTS
jgi:hypothetical protein